MYSNHARPPSTNRQLYPIEFAFCNFPPPNISHQPQRTQQQKYRDSNKQHKGRDYQYRQYDYRGRNRQHCERQNQNQRKYQESREPALERPSLEDVDSKLYSCPECLRPFDCFSRTNGVVGKVPLVLNCRHTVCQECIYKSAVSDSIVCPVCKNPSVLVNRQHIDNLQDVFRPNFYLLGLIMWSKSVGSDFRALNLIPAQQTANKKKINPEEFVTAVQEAGETCCFLSCNKTATLHCHDCNDVYCADCCAIVHKSAKSLWSHKQLAISKKTVTLDLEKCDEHSMDIEFFCKTCRSGACCYCFIEKHEGHEKDHLSKLSDLEMDELKSYKAKAGQIFRQLLVSQRRLKDLQNFNTSEVEKKISNYFVNYHAKLQFIEKNLRKEVASFQGTGGSTKDLDTINSTLTTSIETLKNILIQCNGPDDRNINLKQALKLLQNVQQTPCYLISENAKGLDTVRFEVDPIAENIDDYFKVTKTDKVLYSLVSSDELPSDYEKDSQYESDADTCASSLVNSTKIEERRLKQKKKSNSKQIVGKTGKLDNEMVEVMHIESLECFYVQLKRMQFGFLQMNREINNYIKIGASTVDQPQLQELYLALYVTKKEKIWCRGRLTEIKNGETEPLYEIYFIDYGSTQTLDITKLKEITPLLAQKKPFAIQCELYNPSFVNWGKNAHVYMAKMINGKDVYMMVKNIHNGVHQVDLMISSSDKGLTSIIDILIHTCSNALNTSSDSSNFSTQKVNSFNSELKIYSNSMIFHKNQTEHVLLANVIDPHHIFIHMAAHADSLKKMNSLLKTRYKNSEHEACIPIEGTYVVVEHKDPIRGNWHRALVKKVDMNSEQAHVLLVDWGHNISVPWTSIRMLYESFIMMESQAILVKLAHIEPYDSSPIWSDKATSFLQKNIRTQDTLKMIIHSVDPLEVALFEMCGNVDLCINAQLVRENLADSTGKISQVVEWPVNDEEDVGFTEEDGLVDTLLKKVEDSAGEESDEDEGDKNIVKQKIDVVKFVSPDLIYIKFVKHEELEQNLHKELQIHYHSNLQTKESWQVDEYCVVNYSNNYVRGRILSKEKDKYRINVYDTATEVVLPAKKIYIFAKYFRKYPNMVFKSHLANIRPAGGDKWSLSSIEALEKIFEKYKDIYGTKVQGDTSTNSLPMDMWYTRVKIGGALEASVTKFISINNKLLKLGLAYKQQIKNDVTDVAGPSVDEQETRLEMEKSDNILTSVIMNIANKSLDSNESDLESNENRAETDMSEVKISDGSDKPNTSIDWNKIIEEEEEATKTKSEQQQQDSPYRTRETEIEDWIPAFPIKDREFKAWITCAETEGILYLRDENLQQVYKEMENNIKEYFDNKPPCEENHRWKPGQVCTISYNDFWYRGKVFKVNGPDEVVAIMIDFGSDHVLSPKQLYREILYPKIPAFASKIKLDRVYAKSGAWLASDYETLLDLVTEYGKVIIKDSVNVDVPLAEVYTDKGLSLNQLLVERCPNLTRCENITDAKSDEEDDDDDPGVIIEEMVNIVEDEILQVEITSQPAETRSDFKFEPFPENAFEKKTPMLVMSVLAYNKVVLKISSADSLAENIVSLEENIQESIESQPVVENIEIGMPCICPYAEDGVWYRAQIYNMDAIDCGYVFVFFVDFGNVESVSVAEIKHIKSEWLDLPVHCRIALLDIELKTDNHLDHVFQHMKKLYMKKKLVEITCKEPLTVNLYNESDEQLAYQSLIKGGLLKVK